MSKLANDRREYERGTLEAADLGDSPLEALARWIHDALDKGAAEPTAMTLATVGVDGMPSARVVLCKGIDPAGLELYTNYESRKGRELAQNPRAAATFFWPTLERQARVEGLVERLPRERSEQYFHSRPRTSQLAALASQQSAALSARTVLEDTLAHLDTAHPDQVPLPSAWGGYLLRPLAIEFWQGRASRLHDRIRFERAGTDAPWHSQRLYP